MSRDTAEVQTAIVPVCTLDRCDRRSSPCESCSSKPSSFAHAASCDCTHAEWVMLRCRANAQQPKLFVGMILILIFAEALALYGLIGVLVLCSCACLNDMLPPSGVVSTPSIADTGLCCAQWALSSRPRLVSRSRLCATG